MSENHKVICIHKTLTVDVQYSDFFLLREPNDIDVAAVYHQLVDVYHSSESENDNESDVVPSTSTGPTTSAAAAKARQTITRR